MTNFEDKNKNINRVFLKGEVKRIFPLFNLKKERVGLIVTIKSENDYPQVVCFGQCAKIILADYPVGSKIFLRGNIQSSKRKNGMVSTSIFCSEILPNNKVADTRFNQFQVQGQVLKSFECRNNKLLLLMKTYVDNRVSTFFIKINDYDFRLHSYEKYQTLFLEGYLRTIKKVDDDGKNNYFTDFIAEKVVDF